ncbi:MAG: NAD(P)/FAD-dependent oxidoreductase [bacterium]
MSSPLKIAVIGGGTAGPAAALFLNRLGHQVTLYERVAEASPVGAGVLLQPTGLQVLSELGLLEPILDHGAPVQQLLSQTPSKISLLDLHYSELKPGLHGIGIHRGVLCHYLFNALYQDNIEVVWGCPIVEIKTVKEGVILKNGKGNSLGPFHFAVIADGARSALRDSLGIVKKSEEYPWGALWWIGIDRDRRFKDCLFQVVEGTEKMVGFLPTGLSLADRKPLVSFFWSVHQRERNFLENYDLRKWKKEVLRLVPKAQELMDQINHPGQLTYAPYFDVVMKPWHTPNVIVIGDAAHAMSPQLGQGVNLGLYDAMVLGECFREKKDIKEAFAIYSRLRRHHLRFYQFITRWLTPFFQSSHTSLGWLRNSSFQVFNGIAPIRKQMIRSMAGLKRGFLRKSLPCFEMPSSISSDKRSFGS